LTGNKTPEDLDILPLTNAEIDELLRDWKWLLNI
jgi:hypothetical protein